MIRTLPALVAALAGCSPAAQEGAVHKQRPDAGFSAEATGHAAAAAAPQAAVGPVPVAVSAAENRLPDATGKSAAEATGRRTLSTAYVRVGPDRLLTVELRGGRVLVLRDVVMRPTDYCGVEVAGGKFCGNYADVAAARPGGAPVPPEPDLAAPNPLSPAPRSEPRE